MATTFPDGTKTRLYTILQCPPEELLPGSHLEVQMNYVENLEAQGASGLVDIITNALDEIDSLNTQITTVNTSSDNLYSSLNINNQYSRTSKSGVQGDESQYLRESRASQIALIERTLGYTAQNQGEFTYA